MTKAFPGWSGITNAGTCPLCKSEMNKSIVMKVNNDDGTCCIVYQCFECKMVYSLDE